MTLSAPAQCLSLAMSPEDPQADPWAAHNFHQPSRQDGAQESWSCPLGVSGGGWGAGSRGGTSLQGWDPLNGQASALLTQRRLLLGCSGATSSACSKLNSLALRFFAVFPVSVLCLSGYGHIPWMDIRDSLGLILGTSPPCIPWSPLL